MSPATPGAGAPAHDAELDDLVARADLDGLVRLAESRCERNDWGGLVRLRHRCRHAVGTGRQLWPAATLAEYLLALRAPGPWAATVLTEDAGRFTPGPLTEVAASTHTWDQLSPHLPDGLGTPLAAVLAHERAVRGEDLRRVDGLRSDVLDVPFVLQPWEPAYALATYGDDGVDAPPPRLPEPSPVKLPPPGPTHVDEDVVNAARELVVAWTAGSNGRCDVVAVEGDHLEAVAALGVPAARIVELAPADALAWAAWAGASGGAHGRRRGSAAGRFSAWWLLAALGGLADEWPVPPDELGQLAADLRWYRWDASEPGIGWQLRLAVADPAEHLAWAVSAVDAS